MVVLLISQCFHLVATYLLTCVKHLYFYCGMSCPTCNLPASGWSRSCKSRFVCSNHHSWLVCSQCQEKVQPAPDPKTHDLCDKCYPSVLAHESRLYLEEQCNKCKAPRRLHFHLLHDFEGLPNRPTRRLRTPDGQPIMLNKGFCPETCKGFDGGRIV